MNSRHIPLCKFALRMQRVPDRNCPFCVGAINKARIQGEANRIAKARRDEESRNRCKASYIIEDECSIMPSQCVREKGHKGQHKTIYYGQWGNQEEVVTWNEGDTGKINMSRKD